MTAKFTPLTMNLIRGIEFPIFRKCLNRVIVLEDGFDDFLGDVFPYAHTVIFDKCDKNFVYYNLNKDTFPRIDSVILNSHPCEPCVLKTFNEKPYFVYQLTPHYYDLFERRWGFERVGNVQKIEDNEYKDLLKSLEYEEARFE